jgi:CRP/FNR family transcriptional regulator, cyclic AMP receptor protein
MRHPPDRRDQQDDHQHEREPVAAVDLAASSASDFANEMAMIDESARSATVVALTDVTVAPIQEQQFLFMVQHTPFFALTVMRVLANRLRRQNRAA